MRIDDEKLEGILMGIRLELVTNEYQLIIHLFHFNVECLNISVSLLRPVSCT